MGAEHFHMGDIGNLVADQNGTAVLTFKTDKWCLGCTDESKNIIEKALLYMQQLMISIPSLPEMQAEEWDV